jgi:hypothetical protein
VKSPRVTRQLCAFATDRPEWACPVITIWQVAKLHCSVEAASTFGGRTSAGHGTQVGRAGASLSGTLTALIPPLVFAGGSPTTL